MTIKHLSVMLATSALAVLATPAFAEAESSRSPEFNFACQTGDVPTTVAQTAEVSESIPVFHWNRKDLPDSLNAEQLCNLVSAKLQDYSAQGYDLSSISFKGDEQAGLPAICASGEDNDCNVILFTLAPAEKPVDAANEVLTAILDKSLQTEKIQSRDRGVQSISYKVDFWSLFGFKFLK